MQLSRAKKVMVKLLKFNGSSLWVVFKQQFEVTSEHNGFKNLQAEKATFLVTTLKSQAVEILQGILLTASYHEIIAELEQYYRQHNLSSIYKCDLQPLNSYHSEC